MNKIVRHKDTQADTTNSHQCNIKAAMLTTSCNQTERRRHLALGSQAMGVMMDNTVRQRTEVEAEAAKYPNIVDTTQTEVVDNIQTANKISIKDQWSIKIVMAHQQDITQTCKE